MTLTLKPPTILINSLNLNDHKSKIIHHVTALLCTTYIKHGHTYVATDQTTIYTMTLTYN